MGLGPVLRSCALETSPAPGLLYPRHCSKRFVHTNLFNPGNNSEVILTLVLVLKMRKLRHREAREVVQGHNNRKCCRKRDSNAGAPNLLSLNGANPPGLWLRLIVAKSLSCAVSSNAMRSTQLSKQKTQFFTVMSLSTYNSSPSPPNMLLINQDSPCSVWSMTYTCNSALH